MISKEKFIHEVEKEMSFLEANKKTNMERKSFSCLSLVFLILILLIFWGVLFFLIKLNEKGLPFSMTLLLLVLSFYAFIRLISSILSKNDNIRKKQNELRESYDRVLSLLGVERSNKNLQRFCSFFPSDGISSAYKIGNLILQNFSARDFRHRRLIHLLYPNPKSKIILFFSQKSKEKTYHFKNIYLFDKNNPIRQIGKEFFNLFTCESCFGYQKKDEHFIMLKYDKFQSCPFFLLNITSPYHLFTSSGYKYCCNKLYDEIVFFKEISKKIDQM